MIHSVSASAKSQQILSRLRQERLKVWDRGFKYNRYALVNFYVDGRAIGLKRLAQKVAGGLTGVAVHVHWDMGLRANDNLHKRRMGRGSILELPKTC
jgi:hypothetical protein